MSDRLKAMNKYKEEVGRVGTSICDTSKHKKYGLPTHAELYPTFQMGRVRASISWPPYIYLSLVPAVIGG